MLILDAYELRVSGMDGIESRSVLLLLLCVGVATAEYAGGGGDNGSCESQLCGLGAPGM